MHIEAVLQRCGWRINGPGNAAERLGVHPNTLRFRMKKLGVVGPSGRRAPTAPTAHRRSGLSAPRAVSAGALGERPCGGSATRRVYFQLDVPRCPDQDRAVGAYALKRVDAGDVGRDQVGQVDLEDPAVRAGGEQFRDLRHTEPTGEAHDTPIVFCDHADPTIHNILLRRNTGATRPAKNDMTPGTLDASDGKNCADQP